MLPVRFAKICAKAPSTIEMRNPLIILFKFCIGSINLLSFHAENFNPYSKIAVLEGYNIETPFR